MAFAGPSEKIMNMSRSNSGYLSTGDQNMNINVNDTPDVHNTSNVQSSKGNEDGLKIKQYMIPYTKPYFERFYDVKLEIKKKQDEIRNKKDVADDHFSNFLE